MSSPQHSALINAATDIAANISNLEDQRKRIALEAFRVLEQHDREIASLAMAVFAVREDAAVWFTRTLSFAGVTPWDLLAAGEIEKVRAIMNNMAEGMYHFD